MSNSIEEEMTHLHSHSDGGDGVHLTFDPRSNGVGLLGELTAHHLVVLLLGQLLLQRTVPLRHQLPNFGPFGSDVLQYRPQHIRHIHDNNHKRNSNKKKKKKKKYANLQQKQT